MLSITTHVRQRYAVRVISLNHIVRDITPRIPLVGILFNIGIFDDGMENRLTMDEPRQMSVRKRYWLTDI